MKKLLWAAALALAAVMASQQTASAWSEFKFSAGVNMGWVGGGNRFFWGLYRSAPYPGGQDLPPVINVVPGGNGGYPAYPYPAYDGHYGSGASGQMTPAAATAPQAYNPYYNTGYQPVGYSYPGYSQYQSPSYWYGR